MNKMTSMSVSLIQVRHILVNMKELQLLQQEEFTIKLNKNQ